MPWVMCSAGNPPVTKGIAIPRHIAKSPLFRHALGIIKAIHASGFQALFAGGFVRDLLLKRLEPGAEYDIDIVTNAKPDAIRRIFQRTRLVGAQFGVVIVLAGGHQYEVASFRSDGEYADGRHPTSIRYASPKEDAKRRDFTINGMFLRPLAHQQQRAEVIDYVQGLTDLDNRLVRAIGSAHQRFAEDRLRMLRALRFATTLGFTVHGDTMAAIQAHASAIGDVSAERIAEELQKAFCRALHPERYLDLLDTSGLLAAILPEMSALRGTRFPGLYRGGSLFAHVHDMLQTCPLPADFSLVLAILFHDLAKPLDHKDHAAAGKDMAAGIMRRLKMSNQHIKTVTDMIAQHRRIYTLEQERPCRIIRFLAKDAIALHLELLRLNILASTRSLAVYNRLYQLYREQAKQPLPPPLLTGHDLMALGIPKGPRYAAILAKVYDLQLEGDLTERDQAIRYVKGHFKQ